MWELLRYRGSRFTGLAPTDAPLAFCKDNLAVSTFEACRIPFHTVATSLASGRKEMLSHGDLALGIVASASIPFLYQPVAIEGEFYCDGGVMDLGPTDTICCRHKLDILIVHYVASRLKGFHGIKSERSESWPISEIVDALLFSKRPWYLSGQPLDFKRCPCGCKVLIVVLEPDLPELPWPQTAKGQLVRTTALTQAMDLLSPWLEDLLNNPSALQKTLARQGNATIGGVHC